MGNTRRISKEMHDAEFYKLLRINPANLPKNLKPDHIRPAYQYTKAEVGGIRHDLPNLR